jgi:hypothetical protein
MLRLEGIANCGRNRVSLWGAFIPITALTWEFADP